jgi:hypothetical protein
MLVLVDWSLAPFPGTIQLSDVYKVVICQVDGRRERNGRREREE